MELYAEFIVMLIETRACLNYLSKVYESKDGDLVNLTNSGQRVIDRISETRTCTGKFEKSV